MTRKTDATLASEKDTTFNNGGAATATEFRAHVDDMIDSKANLDVTDALPQTMFGQSGSDNINSLTEDLPPIDTGSDLVVQRDNGDWRRVNITNLPADHTATNYTAASEILGDHFAGIDTALGAFGTAADEDVGTSAGDVVQLDGSARLPAVDGSQLTNLPSGSVPVDDTTALVRDPADNTKLVRIDAGAVATGTTRTITMPDADVDLGDEVTGTEGDGVGFDGTPQAVSYTRRFAANVNLYDMTKPASFTAPFNATIVSCSGLTDTGTVNIAVDIAGTGVTGLGAVALDTTIAGNRDASSGANSYTAWQVVNLTPSGASGDPTRALVVVEMVATSLPVALT